MSLLNSDRSYLGIDLGIENIKVVELKEFKGHPMLVTYGFIDQPIVNEREGLWTNPKRAAAILKKVLEKSRVTTKKVIGALPVSSVFSSVINLSNVNKDDLASTKRLAPIVHWEAKKLIPLPLEEMRLDWKIINKGDAADLKSDGVYKNVKVLITAATRELVDKYREVFKLACLDLISLETESFALLRSLVGIDRSVVSIIDIGAVNTNISIIDEGVPYFNRSVDFGGAIITKMISERLGVGMAEAEQFKADLSLSENSGNSKLLEEVLSILINEIRYCFNLYHENSDKQKVDIEKIILTGGASLFPGLAKYLSNTLNIRVYVGDPWARIVYPEDLKPVLAEIGPKFAVAIGLAMRDI